MNISGTNLADAKKLINSASLLKGGTPSHNSPAPTFVDVMNLEFSNKLDKWHKTEQSVHDVVMGTQDSENVVPMVAQMEREFETFVSLVENIKGAISKLLETQI